MLVGVFLTACPVRAQLAIRTGQENCWARYRVAADRSLCVPHRIWVRSFGVGTVPADRWRATSPPSLNRGDPKQVRYVQSSTFFAPTHLQCWDRVQQWIEKRREEESLLLKDSGADTLGIFRHLLLGESAPSVPLLQILGFAHFVTASGIHLALLLIALRVGVGSLGTFFELSPELTLWTARILGFGATLWAWLLAGAPWRMLRPILYLAIRRLSKLLGVRWQKGAPLILSFVFDLCIDLLRGMVLSEAVRDPGRMYYLLASGAYLISSKDRRTWIIAGIAPGLVLSVFTLTNQRWISLLAPLTASLDIFLFAGVAYPLLLLHSIVPISAFLSPLSFIQSILRELIAFSLWSQSIWYVSSTGVVLGIGVSSLLGCAPRSLRLKVIWFSLASILLFNTLWDHSEKPRELTADSVEQLDVGQGDSALVRSQDSVGLIDTGSAHVVHETDWLRVLSNRGILKLDWVALTHLDEDHSGGTLTLSSLVPIHCVTTSQAELESARGVRFRAVLESHGVRFVDRLENCYPYPALEPLRHPSGRKSANENMSAFLVPLKGGGFYLSAGDATAKDEVRIGNWAKAVQKSLSSGPHVLKLSHHGSKTSSNPIFLRAVQPTEIWISDGVGNPFGHPSPIVLQRLKAFAVPIRRTDQEGTIQFIARDK